MPCIARKYLYYYLKKCTLSETLPETVDFTCAPCNLRAIPHNSAQYKNTCAQFRVTEFRYETIPFTLKKFTYILVNSVVLRTTVFCWFRSFLYNLALLFNPTKENNPNISSKIIISIYFPFKQDNGSYRRLISHVLFMNWFLCFNL